MSNSLPCPNCGQEMAPRDYGAAVYMCSTCGTSVTVELAGGWPSGKKLTCYATGIDPSTAERDCHCGHSWYDHIGWRRGQNDRSNCRIVQCGCEAYTAKWT